MARRTGYPAGFQKEAKDRMDENSSCSIVTLNIHQFKFFNEIFGKERADRLLKAVGEQAEKELGESRSAENAVGNISPQAHSPFHQFLPGKSQIKHPVDAH